MKPRWLLYVGVMFSLAIAAQYFLRNTPGEYKEVALVFGEPWVDMQKRSGATIPDPIPGEHWHVQPEQISTFRFADPQFAFTTPPAKFFTIHYDDAARIRSIRISPVLEPLPLEQALQVMLDLQDQWKKKGWVVTNPDTHPAIEDTSIWRERLAGCSPNDTYWHVDEQYQILAFISCFESTSHPEEQRFMVTLSMGAPWYKPWEHE